MVLPVDHSHVFVCLLADESGPTIEGVFVWVSGHQQDKEGSGAKLLFFFFSFHF